jgi:hypothetical protein
VVQCKQVYTEKFTLKPGQQFVKVEPLGMYQFEVQYKYSTPRDFSILCGGQLQFLKGRDVHIVQSPVEN